MPVYVAAKLTVREAFKVTTACVVNVFALAAVFVELCPEKHNRLPSSELEAYMVEVALPEKRIAFGDVTPSIAVVVIAVWLALDVLISITLAVVLVAAAPAATKTVRLPAVKFWACRTIPRHSAKMDTNTFFIVGLKYMMICLVFIALIVDAKLKG